MAGANLSSNMAQVSLLSKFIHGDESTFLHETRCHSLFVFLFLRDLTGMLYNNKGARFMFYSYQLVLALELSNSHGTI